MEKEDLWAHSTAAGQARPGRRRSPADARQKWDVVRSVSLVLTGLLLATLYTILLLVVVLSGAESTHLLLIFLLPLVGPVTGALLGGFPLLVPDVRRNRCRRRPVLGTLALGALIGTLCEWIFVLSGIRS